MYLSGHFRSIARKALRGFWTLTIGVTLVAALLGSGAFTMPTWAWVALGVPMLVIFVVAMRYGDRIESWLFEKFRKLGGRKK